MSEIFSIFALMGKNIVILGPAYPYRGGIAAFNERLAQQLAGEGNNVKIMTFRVQYPSFLFPGKTQYSEDPAPRGLDITRSINSINPLNWIAVGLKLRRLNPDMVITAFWLPYMAPSLGTIARIGGGEKVGLVHNLIPHEHKKGDRFFARYFCRSMDRFVTLSDSVASDVRSFAPGKAVACSPHPVYDNFGASVSKEEACAHLGLDPGRKILLSFGLIRDYKGLDWLIEAFASLPDRSKVTLVVAGEFYSDPERYHAIARNYGVDAEIVWKTEFVPDSEVKYYFGAADLVVQPYKSATQSGITQIAYHFGKPMLVTNVGGLAETVPDGIAGYAVEPSPAAVSSAIGKFLAESPDFSEGLSECKKRYSWTALCDSIMKNR